VPWRFSDAGLWGLVAGLIIAGVRKPAQIRTYRSTHFGQQQLTRLRVRPTRHVATHTKLETFASSLATQAELSGMTF
jgi:hypothetical protein